MANPTTNYGFVLPTSSDLVTDLPADFDVALQGVDTRLKALQPGTTLGDLAYSSATANTNTRLGVGSTGQVLTVAGGVPSWATPAGGSDTWTTVASSALSGLSTITISSLNYNKITIWAVDTVGSNTSADMRVRFNGSTTLADYDQGFVLGNVGASSNSFLNYPGLLSGFDVADVGGTGGLWLNLENGKSTSKKPISFVGGSGGGSGGIFNGFGNFNGSAAITSVTVFLSSGTWSSGTLYVYGA